MVAGIVASSTTVPSLLLPKVGPKVVVSTGFLVSASGMALLTQLTLNSAYVADIMPGMILLGIGAVMATVLQGATAGVHHEDAGVASALINTSQHVGGSISTALLTTVASSAATDYLSSHQPSALTMTQARGRELHGPPGVGRRDLRGRRGAHGVPVAELGSGAVGGRGCDRPLSLSPQWREMPCAPIIAGRGHARRGRNSRGRWTHRPSATTPSGRRPATTASSRHPPVNRSVSNGSESS
ncbi:hypothetical protein ACIBO6_29415 [Streptomyces luteogriseus]|uniref:hypothetical protein n=1 Tax=Streptomyces luteogriseus TaxID=68233 RepID=UPI0037913AEE